MTTPAYTFLPTGDRRGSGPWTCPHSAPVDSGTSPVRLREVA